MRIYSFFFFLLFLTACSDQNLQTQVNQLKSDLETAQSTIENLQTQIEPEGDLVHVVFFKTKPDADLNALGAAIEKLASIKEVKDLQYGSFEDLGDARALDFDLMMEMSFDSEADYKIYQAHPVHLQLKEAVKSFLAGPPATYDYLKK